MSDLLLDRWCLEPHEAAITAAAFDPHSGASITADEWGTVSITRAGEKFPGLIFAPGDAIYGAVAINPGGSLVAVGDEQGCINVYKTDNGDIVFHDLREGDEGRQRAMRSMAFNPHGTMLATLSTDGIIRIFDIQRWERIANYRGFGGDSLEFDCRGDNLLCIDNLGQPKRIDMLTRELLDLELVPGGVRVARFTPDGSRVVAVGQGGITLLSVDTGHIENSFTAQGSSGMLNVVINPEGNELGAVTGRSVHRFSLPDLTPCGSDRHGAAEPTNAAWWDFRGVAVGGKNGLMHRPDQPHALEPVVCVGGVGPYRVAVHGDRIAVWHKHRRKRPFSVKHRFIEVEIDRDGKLLCGLPETGPVQVFEARTGKSLFDCGRDSANTSRMAVGGAIVACMLNEDGMRWYDLESNQVLALPWVQDFALSGSGTWIAAITPRGNVRIIDPKTGQDYMPPPNPLADVPTRLCTFINKEPSLLVLDEEGVLGHYDLTRSVNDNEPAEGRDVLDFNVPIDRIWGITGGRLAVLRLQDYDAETASLVYVDLDAGEVLSEVTDLLPYVTVDVQDGRLMQPARGKTIWERDQHGNDLRMLRSLPDGEWIAFDNNRQVLDASDGALN